MRKKLLIMLVAATIVLSFSAVPSYGAQEIQVVADGVNVNFDVPPVMENNRVLVPIRGIFERLGAKVHWEDATGAITAVKENTKISLKVGSKQAYINDVPLDLDVPAKVIKGRTLVPIRFISQALGAEVAWDQDSKTVVIKTDPTPEQPSSSITPEEEGVQINKREFRLGEQVTVKQDKIMESEKVHILIRPSHDNVIIPSAPEPYPTGDSILIATIPVENHRFSYSFTLTPELGTMVDGSAGKMGPGAWELTVSGDYGGEYPLLILPAEVPEPKAVVYNRGKIYTWTKGQGLKTGVLKNPAASPLIMSETQWGGEATDLSLEFIRDWLDIPAVEESPGKYRLGDAELGLTVLENQSEASINGTSIQLGGQPLRKLGQMMRIPWDELGYFFGYRCQWLGPESLVMLRQMDEIPQEIRQVLEDKDEMDYKPGETVTLEFEGKPMDLGDKHAFMDTSSGRVLVPLRETAIALGAQLGGFQLKRSPELDEIMAEHNHGLIDVGPEVKSYINALLGRKMWRVYLTAETEQNTMISIDELTLALGYTYTWDKENHKLTIQKGL